MKKEPEFLRSVRVRTEHPYQWLWESLERDAGFVLKPMFGGKAAYLDGRLALYFTAGEEPWRGILVCTDKTRHEALIAEFHLLRSHPVLPKWLYLSETEEGFETVAKRLVHLAADRDPRIGVDPKPKKRRKAAPRQGRDFS